MKLREWSAPEWLAVAAGAIGVVVLAGYALHSTLLVQIQPGQNVAMVPSTAASLILAALALLYPRRPRLVFALLLLALNLAQLLELAAGVNLGIDFPQSYPWLRQQAVHPGRMSQLSNTGFLLLAVALLVLPGMRRRWAWLERWLTWLVIATGVAGVLGYFLRLDLIYRHRGLTRAALHSAIGIFLLGLALWLSWRDRHWNRPPAGFEQASRIMSAATLMLMVVIVVAAFSGLLMMRRLAENSATANLTLRRQERINYVSLLIRQAVAEGLQYTQDPDLIRFLEHPPGAKAPAVPPDGFSSIAVLQAGQVVLSAGEPAIGPAAAVKVPLPIGPGTALLWDGGFYLRQQLPVKADARTLGTAVMERRLPLLGAIGVESPTFGRSGEVGLCGLAAPHSSAIVCFPQRLHPEPFSLPAGGYGYQHPMLRAILGETGVIDTIDYRGERVLAAYAPVAGLGLGLVVKMDSRELYAPVRRELNFLAPILIALALIGIELLRWQVRPLVAQLVASRNQTVSSEARFRAAAESGMDPFYIFESVRSRLTGGITGFRLVYANLPGETFAGLQPGRGEMLGLSSVPQLRAAGDVLAKMQQVVVRREHWVEEFALGGRHLPNGPRWLHLQAVPLSDGAAVTLRDISERKWEEERLRVMAQTDALTGLANRDAFHKRLADAMAHSHRLPRQTLLAVLYLDVDHFKDINDTYGHTMGDRVLQTFAARLLRAVRSADTVARPGGDEFVILLENMESPQDAERVVAAIFAALQDPIHINNVQVSVATSIGLAYYRGENIGPEELLQRADMALYSAKRSGKNTWQQFAD